MKKSSAQWVLVFIMGFVTVLTGCTRKSNQSRTVNVAAWSYYMTPEIAAAFETATGIKIVVSNYSSNEELLAKLQAGASGYDVAIPSDYMVRVMQKLKLIEKLDRSKLKHWADLDSKYLGLAYDPQNEFSVPYSWGTTGFAVNTSLAKSRPKSWKEFFASPDIRGKFVLMDDVRETMGLALKTLGFSLNSKNPNELLAAKNFLIGVKKFSKGFSAEQMAGLANQEVSASHVFSADALNARKRTEGKIEYTIPSEGGTFWLDNLVIPVGAKNKEEAHVFIDYMMEGQHGANLVKTLFMNTPSRVAMGLLDPVIKNDPMQFPSQESLKKCEMIEDLGEDLKLYDRIWTEIKAGT